MDVVSDQERILDAALIEFAAKGYEGTQVSTIADQAGLSTGSLFRCFPSKERILLTLMDRFAAAVERRIRRVIAVQDDGMYRVEGALEVCLDMFSQYRRQTKILFSQVVGLGIAFEVKRREIQSRFARYIRQFLDEAIAQKQIPPVDTEVIAEAWMGAIYHLVMTWVYTGEPERERLKASLVPMLLHSVEYRSASSEPLPAYDADKQGVQH